MLAVSEDHSACVVTLLNHGADINITDADGHSALFRAVSTILLKLLFVIYCALLTKRCHETNIENPRRHVHRLKNAPNANFVVPS